ncbi:NADH:flavin oxidoreductase/NADH oxidase [Cladochytrium replicatum]|nr:NADH:flavin oxidoreductase/NADH oxidase [Cladochytrium replicatum]
MSLSKGSPAFLHGSHPSLPNLFSPIKVGDMTLSHRVVMGPMTRSRAPGSIANDQQALYYHQRATPGGLLISEGTPPSVSGHGYAHVPSLITREHALAWRKSTAAVHDVGGYIYAQLWHVGRVSSPQFQPNGASPVSASEIPLLSRNAPKGSLTHPLTVPEIKAIVQEYKTSADLAVHTAGFDGVEIHGAHGYLIDQFLHANTNSRTDEYGGSIENRARFVLEIVEAVLHAVPASKVGIRLSPGAGIHKVRDDNYVELFSYVFRKLQKYPLAYIHLTEPGWADLGIGPARGESVLNQFIPLIKEPTKVLITGGYLKEVSDQAIKAGLARVEYAENFGPATAKEALKAGKAQLVFKEGASAGTGGEEAIKSGRAHLVGYATSFIPNPDFVKRLWYGWPLTMADQTHYYAGTETGYSDWPSYLESGGAKVFKKASL